MMMSINTEQPKNNNDVFTIENTILKMTSLNHCIWQNEKPITLNCISVVWWMFKTFCENERSFCRKGHPLSWPPGLFLSIWKLSSCVTDSNQIDWWDDRDDNKIKKLSINFFSWILYKKSKEVFNSTHLDNINILQLTNPLHKIQEKFPSKCNDLGGNTFQALRKFPN